MLKMVFSGVPEERGEAPLLIFHHLLSVSIVSLLNICYRELIRI